MTDWIDQLRDVPQHDESDPTLDALDAVLPGGNQRRAAAQEPVVRGAQVEATFDDGSTRLGRIDAMSPDACTSRVVFSDGGTQWFATAGLRARPSREASLEALDAVFTPVQAEPLGRADLGEGVTRTVVAVPLGQEGNLDIARRFAGLDGFDAESAGPGRTAIFGYTDAPAKEHVDQYQQAGVLADDGVMDMGRHAESGGEPDGAGNDTANAEALPPALDEARERRLQEASQEVHDMVLDAWAERGREAGAGTLDRVASIFFGRERTAQVAPLRGGAPRARSRNSKMAPVLPGDRASAPQDSGEESLADILAMSRSMPDEAPIVHRLIVDYLADNPEALDALGAGAYQKALRGAVDYWRAVNPHKLERVRKQVAPDISMPVPEADIQAGPTSWWDRVKMALSPRARTERALGVDQVQAPQAEYDIPEEPPTEVEIPTQRAPSAMRGGVPVSRTPVTFPAGDLPDLRPAWEQYELPSTLRSTTPDRGIRPDESLTWQKPLQTMHGSEAGTGTAGRPEPTWRAPAVRGMQAPTSTGRLPAVDPRSLIQDLTFGDQVKTNVQPATKAGRMPITQVPGGQKMRGKQTSPPVPRRQMAATPEVVAELARRIAQAKPTMRYPDQPWNIQVDNATSTGHWLMLDVSWPKEGCPVDANAPAGLVNLAHLIKGRAHGWMQHQRNLGLSAWPNMLSLDPDKRTARLSVSVIGAVSYPQAVMTAKNPALKDEEE